MMEKKSNLQWRVNVYPLATVWYTLDDAGSKSKSYFILLYLYFVICDNEWANLWKLVRKSVLVIFHHQKKRKWYPLDDAGSKSK